MCDDARTMISLGFKRKDMGGYFGCPCAPCETSDPKKKAEYENELQFPEISFDGKQAEAMGIDDLDLDEVVEVTLKLKVKGLRCDERITDGKKQRDLCLRFTVLEASDYTAVEGEEESETEGEAAAPEAEAMSNLIMEHD